MVHIAKRSCHWYYGSFSRCIASEGEEVGATSVGNREESSPVMLTNGLRVAVIVAGTLQRFMFSSTVEKLIGPLVESNVVVDYYASLTTVSTKAYRSDNIYMDHIQPDPTLPKSVFHDDVNIEEYMRVSIGSHHASVGALRIHESIDIDSEPMLKARRQTALIDHPHEDPDLRFPLFDVRNEEIGYRTANANRNLLRMHLATQNLWTSAVKWEEEEGFKYDYVLFVRDDALWLDNFNIHKLNMREGDVFVPSCDARDPPLESSEINDHILISRRDTAHLFGNYYSTLFETDLKGCMDRMPEKLTKGGTRGCNSEMLLKWVTDVQNLKVTKVGQGTVPFQRSANVKLPDGSNKQCFHKFCQSHSHPLNLIDLDQDIEICKDVDWNNIQYT